MQSGQLVADFIATGTVARGIYLGGKVFLDSIWDGYLTFLGETGILGDENVQYALYHLMNK